MAHVETIMTSAPSEKILNALCQIPGIFLLERKAEIIVLDFQGDLIDVEEVKDEDGSFYGLTTAIDVYGSTGENAKRRTEGLLTALGSLGLFELGMYPDNDGNFRWHSSPNAG